MFCITGLKSVDEEEEVVEGDLAVVVEIEGWVPVGMKDRQAERVDETEKIAETNASVAVEIAGFGFGQRGQDFDLYFGQCAKPFGVFDPENNRAASGILQGRYRCFAGGVDCDGQ